LSALSTEALRYRDAEFSIVATAAHDETFPFAEVNCRTIELLEPGILVTRAEKQEKSLNLEASAGYQQFVNDLGSYSRQALEQLRGVHKARLALVNEAQHFHDCTLKTRGGHGPIAHTSG
jgi:hypothetical protein